MRPVLLLLCVAWIGVGVLGCQSKPPKNAVSLSMHLPAPPGLPSPRRVPVALETPAISLEVNSIPALLDADLDSVELVGEGEDYQMRLVFRTHGTIELDRLSNNNRGEPVVIFINGVPVAAPLLKERIVDGIFVFTPNLTRAEADKAVEGITAMIKYREKKRY